MATWILTLIVPVLIAALWHGFSLRLACTIAGERTPPFGRAMVVSWLGGLLGVGAATVWTYTLGLVVSLLLSAWLAFGIGMLIQLGITAGVYRRGLRLSGPAAFGVTGIHYATSLAVNAALGWFTYNALV